MMLRPSFPPSSLPSLPVYLSQGLDADRSSEREGRRDDRIPLMHMGDVSFPPLPRPARLGLPPVFRVAHGHQELGSISHGLAPLSCSNPAAE